MLFWSKSVKGTILFCIKVRQITGTSNLLKLKLAPWERVSKEDCKGTISHKKVQIKGHSEDFLTVLVWFKSAKKYNKSIPTQSQSGPLYVWKVQKDKVILILKVGPLGKGQQ